MKIIPLILNKYKIISAANVDSEQTFQKITVKQCLEFLAPSLIKLLEFDEAYHKLTHDRDKDAVIKDWCVWVQKNSQDGQNIKELHDFIHLIPRNLISQGFYQLNLTSLPDIPKYPTKETTKIQQIINCYRSYQTEFEKATNIILKSITNGYVTDIDEYQKFQFVLKGQNN